MSSISHRCVVMVVFLAGFATSAAHATMVWNLQPTTGDNGTGWAAEPNWTWTDGNPLADNGASWSLSTQLSAAPTLTSTYTNMASGYLSNFYRVWRGSGQDNIDAPNVYRDYKLTSRNSTTTPGAGPTSVILFTPPDAGEYRFEVAGLTTYVQSNTAGYGKVTLYTLSSDGTSATELTSFNLNTSGGFGSYPAVFAFDQVVTLAAGERFALRVQGVNPGPAAVGTVQIDLSPTTGGTFTVTEIVPEPASIALVGLGGLLIVRRGRRCDDAFNFADCHDLVVAKAAPRKWPCHDKVTMRTATSGDP